MCRYYIKTAYFVFLSLLILFVSKETFAGVDYEDLKKEFKEKSNVSGVNGYINLTEGEEKSVTGTKSDVLKKVAILQEKWLESIKSEKSEEFYTIDEALKKKVEAVFDDDKKIRELLKEEVSLDLLIGLLLYRNPAIISAGKKIDAANERFSQIANLEMIMRDYIAFTQSLNLKLSSQKNMRMVSMTYPFPGMVTLKGEIVKKDVYIQRLSYEKTKAELITELKKAYHNLLYFVKEEETTRKTSGLLSELEQVANIKYETGKTSFNDVIKVQIKMEKLKDRLTTIAENKENVRVMISKMIDMPADTAFGKAKEAWQDFSTTLDELYETGQSGNRDIRLIEEKIKRMELMIEMAEQKFYPDFTMGYSYFDDNKEKKVGTQAIMDAFMMKPMDSFKKDSMYAKNDAYLREVKQELAAMKEMLRAKRNFLTASIKNAHYHLDKAKREAALYKGNLISKAEEALKVARIGYETGNVSFLDALDADMIWLDFNVEYYKAIRHIAVSISDLESLTYKMADQSR